MFKYRRYCQPAYWNTSLYSHQQCLKSSRNHIFPKYRVGTDIFIFADWFCIKSYVILVFIYHFFICVFSSLLCLFIYFAHFSIGLLYSSHCLIVRNLLKVLDVNFVSFTNSSIFNPIEITSPEDKGSMNFFYSLIKQTHYSWSTSSPSIFFPVTRADWTELSLSWEGVDVH